MSSTIPEAQTLGMCLSVELMDFIHKSVVQQYQTDSTNVMKTLKTDSGF